MLVRAVVVQRPDRASRPAPGERTRGLWGRGLRFPTVETPPPPGAAKPSPHWPQRSPCSVWEGPAGVNGRRQGLGGPGEADYVPCVCACEPTGRQADPV